MSTLQQIRASLVEVSRRYSRASHEVEDLAHDIILSALRRGSALDGETFLRSVHGAARRHGAFLARSAGRRRAREVFSAGADVADGNGDTPHDVDEGAPLFVVKDLRRTHRFYSETLGLTFEVTDFEGGYLQARLPGDVEFVFLPGEAARGDGARRVEALVEIEPLIVSWAARRRARVSSKARPDPSPIPRPTYGAHVPTHVGGMLFVQAIGTHVSPLAQPVVTGGSPEVVQRPPVEDGSQFPVFGLQTEPV
jgi:hypothetical protein